MADISILSRVIDGAVRNVDLPSNTPVVLSIKIGGGSNTELTKVILDSLIALRTDLASNANAKGASLVGIEDAGSLITATTVEGALAEIVGKANTAEADAQTAISAAAAAQSTANAAIPLTQKGAALGVATLDSGGKVPVAQLPNSVMEFKGNWDASSNTPTLADGTGNAGDVYRVNVAGTQDLGSGPQVFVVGDYVVYDGAIWDLSHGGGDAVNSVFGRTGVVVATSGDYTTAQVTEDSGFKYFTDTRAKTAAVVNSLGGSQTDQAPSVAAVNAALAGISTGGLTETIVAGESFASGALRAVRWAKAADSGFVAGRAYKADNDSTSADNFWVAGLCLPGSSVIAGGNLSVVKAGIINAPSHGFTVGQPLWLTTAGALSSTAPSTALQASVKVGMVRDANNIEVSIQVMGVN